MSADPTVIEKSTVGERMFAYRRGLFKGHSMPLCLIASISLLIAGCGDDSGSTSTDASAPEASTSSTQTPAAPEAPEADTADADAADLEVIESWSAALTEGDVEAAAEFFATPSTAENGPILIRIESDEDAIAFNESLPCGSEVISARTEGDFTTATFLLSSRPGAVCGQGVGGTASTSFEIEDGMIVEWRRIDEPPPGGNGGGEGGAAPI